MERLIAQVQPLRRAGENLVSLLCTRDFLNQIGTGGLLSPALIYRDKDQTPRSTPAPDGSAR